MIINLLKMYICHQDWLNTGFEYENHREKQKNHVTTYEDNSKKTNSSNSTKQLEKYNIVDEDQVEEENIIDYKLDIIYNMVVLLNPIIEDTFNLISDKISEKVSKYCIFESFVELCL